MGSTDVGAALLQHPQHQQGQPWAQRCRRDSWGHWHCPPQAPSPAACGSEVSATAVAAGQQEGEVVLSPVMEKTPGPLCSFPRSPCDSVPQGELLSTETLTHTAASQQPTKGLLQLLKAAIRQEPAACKLFSSRFRSEAPASH